MSLKCGIIGLPNVGKSTLFKALTKVEVPIENYAFCTIDPHKAIVKVPDSRLDRISKILRSQRAIPTSMEFVDIAGLVQGAHRGEGLGNQFLSHIREAHALIHVLRCFDDPKITHVSHRVNPVEDMEIVKMELILSDLQSVENFLKKKSSPQKKDSKISDQKVKKEILEPLIQHLSSGKSAKSFFRLNPKKEKENLRKIQFLPLLTLKPVLYLCNLGERKTLSVQSENLEEPSVEKLENPYFDEISKKLKEVDEESKILNLCASLEAEISELNLEDQAAFLKDLNVKEPGLSRLIRESYALLGLETFFTAGPKEVRAWTIRKGTTALKAGGFIHTDFEKGFIRAEVFHCEDLFRYKEEKQIRAKGLYRLEGKDYKVKDGDILFFRFNV